MNPSLLLNRITVDPALLSGRPTVRGFQSAWNKFSPLWWKARHISRAFSIHYAHVTMRIAGQGEFREWPAWVAFTPAALRRPLLGYAGFLQYFAATFQVVREELELAVVGNSPRHLTSSITLPQ